MSVGDTDTLTQLKSVEFAGLMYSRCAVALIVTVFSHLLILIEQLMVL